MSSKHNPTLGMTPKQKRDFFVEKSISKFGDKYDYSLIKEVDLKRSPCKVICPIHGVTETTFERHLGNASGCASCGDKMGRNSKKITFEEFLVRFSEINSDLKIISRSFNGVGIKKAKLYVQTEFGICKMTASALLLGATHSTRSSVCKTTYYLNRFQKKHNHSFLYPDFTYVSPKEPFTVVCPVHGGYITNPNVHLDNRGKGCPDCGRARTRLALKSNTEDFITKSKLIHGDTYDYSKSDYINARHKVVIGCKYHGEFLQDPNSHLSGYGCFSCGQILSSHECTSIKESKYIPSGVYLMHFPKEGFYKIGISKSYVKRLNDIKSESKFYDPICIYYKEMSLFDAFSLETKLHKKYKNLSYEPKVYFAGKTECFNSNLPINEISEILT